MKAILLSAVALLFALQLQAQTHGTLKGQVKTQSGAPVPFASLVLQGSTKGASSNESGWYAIQRIPAGRYTLLVSAVGHTTVQQEVIIEADQESEQFITLQETAGNLDEVVIKGQKRRISSATKTLTPLENLPMSVQILDNDILLQQQIIDVRDAVKNVSGMTVTGSYNGGYTFYNSRGFNMNNWSNFRRNGMFIWNMGHHFSDNIEQIEFLKGPASILFGDVAPGGVMNFVTKRPLVQNYRRFEMKAGQYGLIRPTIDFSGPLNESKTLLYRLNATYERSESFRDKVNNESVMLAPSVTWKITPELTWDVEATYKHDQRVGDPGLISPDGTFEGLKTIPVSTFLGETSGTYTFSDKAIYSTLSYQLNGNWKIRNQSYYNRTTRDARQIYFVGTSADEQGEVRRRQYFFNQWFTNWGNNLDLIGEVQTGFIRHQVVLGTDYMQSFSQFTNEAAGPLDTTINIYNPVYGQANLRVDPMVWNPAGSVYRRLGIYAQDQMSVLNDRIQLLIGLRYNNIRNGSHYFEQSAQPEGFFVPVARPLSPRLGIVYKPLKNTSLYGSYTESFETNGNDWINPAVVIDPTFATQTEFGVKNSFFADRLGITLSAFRIDKRNLYSWINAVDEPAIPYISWDQEGEWATYQGGHHQSRGIELDINGKLFDGLTLNGAYAFVDARVINDPAFESGNQLAGNSRNTFSLWANYRLGNYVPVPLRGLELGYGFYYKDKFFQNTSNESNTLVDSFYSMDASVGYNYKNFTTRLNVTNLTNNIGYISSRGIYEPLWVRRAVLSVAVRF